MVTKKMKSIILTLAIVSGIFFQTVSYVSASEVKEFNDKKISIIEINTETLLINGEDGSSETLKYESLDEKGNGKIAIQDNVTGEKYFFELREDGSIYSSKTGKIVEESITIQPRSTTSYVTKYYSYKQIVTMLGTGLTLAGIAGGIAGLLARSGIKVAGQKIIALIADISGVMGAISLTNPSSNHGIAVKLKATKYYRFRAGRKTVYRTDYTPLKAWRY